jgi:hypothetical protein
MQTWKLERRFTRRRGRLAALPAIVLMSASLAACRDVSRFSTDPGESYCGEIVSVSIVRLSFSERLCMRLTLDTERLNFIPGAIWTDDGMFWASPLRPIPQLSHDPLLTLNFGEGREKNLLFGIDPADPARGPSLMAFVSLLHSGEAEVRLVRGAAGGPSPPPPVGDAAVPLDGPPLFGVFAPLKRQKGDCRQVPGCAWPPE